MKFGEILESIRKEKGDSFRKLAEKIGFSYAYIQQIETGIRPASLDFLEKILEVYKDKKEILELKYCEDKIPKSLYVKVDEIQKIEVMIGKIKDGTPFEELYNNFFKYLSVLEQKKILNIIIEKLEKEKFFKDEIELKRIKRLIETL